MPDGGYLFWSFWPDVARATHDGMSDGPPYWLALTPVAEMTPKQRRAELDRIAKRLEGYYYGERPNA